MTVRKRVAQRPSRPRIERIIIRALEAVAPPLTGHVVFSWAVGGDRVHRVPRGWRGSVAAWQRHWYRHRGPARERVLATIGPIGGAPPMWVAPADLEGTPHGLPWRGTNRAGMRAADRAGSMTLEDWIRAYNPELD